jgi:hypothetical protein
MTTMTVAELISVLRDFPQNANVYLGLTDESGSTENLVAGGYLENISFHPNTSNVELTGERE